jgi:hypothetical protein
MVLGLSSFDTHLRGRDGVCDLSDLRFVDAFGLVGSACAILAACEGGSRPRVELPGRPRVRQHLAGMGFIRFLQETGFSTGAEAGPLNEHEDVVVPLSFISDHSDTERLSNLLFAQVRDHVDPPVVDTLAEGLWEMVGNALEHAHAGGALLMGQVYRGGHPPDHDDRVQIVIGDVGRGIRRSLVESGKFDDIDSDETAIRKALEYLVSSVHDPGRGQGLTTTAEEVARLQGRLVIHSGEARVTSWPSDVVARDVPQLPGTLVALDLPLYPGTK